MRVYIFSLPQNLQTARKIHDFLNLKGHSVKLFDSDSQFFSFVYQKEKIPDFVVYDYLFFNHNLWNIYNFMKNEDCLVPLIFFNDPALHSESTEFFFKNMLNLIHAENKIDWEKYEQIVSDAAKIIDSAKNEKQKSVAETKIAQEIQNPAENQHKNPETRISKELSGINLAIFKKLFKNLNNSVPLKELQNSEELKKQVQETTVFCAISKIRKAMKAADEDSFEIIKNPDGYTMISRY